MTNTRIIWAVVGGEWRRAVRDGRLRTALWLWVVLGAVSVLAGFQAYHGAQQTATAGNREARRHWQEQGPKNPHGAAHFGLYVFREPSPGVLFDPGVTPFSGSTVFVEAHGRNNAGFQPVRHRTALARFGDPSPAFLLIHLAPLLLILLHFRAVTESRTSGVLWLIAGTGVSARQWLAGQWLAAYVPALAGTAVICAAVCLISGEINPTAAPWPAVALGLMLYLATVVQLILWVGTRMRRGTDTLLVLLGLWMAGTVAAPRLAADLAERLYPTPLEAVFKDTAARTKQERLAPRMATLAQDTLAAYGVDSLETLPINFDALAMETDEQVGDAVNDGSYAALYAARQKQQRVYRCLALLWPMLPMRTLSMAAARTDEAAHRRFNEDVETYRRGFVHYLNHEMMVKSKTGDWAFLSDTDTWRAAPIFTPHEATASDRWPAVRSDLALLAAWCGLSAWLLLVRAPARLFRRHP